MKGKILINAYLDSREYLYEAERLFEEFEKLGVDVSVVRLDKYPAIISDGKISIDFFADFFVYLDKDKYVLTMLEKSGAKVFNNARAIQTCDDKMSTYIALSDNGVPMPKTLPGILCYNQNEKIKEKNIEKIEKELAYPLIVKESYGSLGKRVYLVKNREDLLITLETVKTKPHLLQEFVEESRGRDLRVIVVGQKYVGAMERFSDVDFRSNVGAGGKGRKADASDEIKNLSEKIAKILNLDYCGIDFLYKDGGVTVCEVNSNAYFFTFEKVTGINVAKNKKNQQKENMRKTRIFFCKINQKLL